MTVCSLGHIPGGHITNHLYSWVDPQGRSVSPPPDAEEDTHGASVDERTVGTCFDLWPAGAAPSHTLNYTIRHGAKHHLTVAEITGQNPVCRCVSSNQTDVSESACPIEAGGCWPAVSVLSLRTGDEK